MNHNDNEFYTAIPIEMHIVGSREAAPPQLLCFLLYICLVDLLLTYVDIQCIENERLNNHIQQF